MRYGSILCLNRDMARLAAHIQLFQPTVIRMVPMVAKALYNKIAILSRQDTGRSLNSIKQEVLGKRLHKIISGGGTGSQFQSSGYFYCSGIWYV